MLTFPRLELLVDRQVAWRRFQPSLNIRPGHQHPSLLPRCHVPLRLVDYLVALGPAEYLLHISMI